MPEKYFRYVRVERLDAWRRAGWRMIGELEYAPNDGHRVAIVEWPDSSSELIVPEEECDEMG